jgi:hypothetical protein
MVSKLKRQPTEWGKNLGQLYIWQGIDNQNIEGAQKTKLPKNQWSTEEMGKWTEQEVQIAKKKKNAEMFNIVGHKGNANQNHIKIPSCLC